MMMKYLWWRSWLLTFIVVFLSHLSPQISRFWKHLPQDWRRAAFLHFLRPGGNPSVWYSARWGWRPSGNWAEKSHRQDRESLPGQILHNVPNVSSASTAHAPHTSLPVVWFHVTDRNGEWVPPLCVWSPPSCPSCWAACSLSLCPSSSSRRWSTGVSWSRPTLSWSPWRQWDLGTMWQVQQLNHSPPQCFWMYPDRVCVSAQTQKYLK